VAPTSSDAPATTAAPETTAATPSTLPYDPNATLTWVASIDPNTFDPAELQNAGQAQHLFPIYDRLIYRTSDLHFGPMLAKSWEILDDGHTLELTLIDNWSFHDGTPFNAAAVVANLERMRTLPTSTSANSLQSISTIEAVDEHTVRIKSESPVGILLGPLSGVPGMMMSPAVFDDPTQDVMPTGGSGAFKVVNFVPGDRTEYEPVDNYWDPDAVKIGKFVITVGADDVRYNSVVTGDGFATFIRPNQAAAAEKESGIVLISHPTINTYTMRLNTARSEFGNVLVRRAVNHAINREAIATGLLEGRCTPEVQIIPRVHWAANPDIGPEVFKYDPDLSRQLLTEAGLPDGFSFSLELPNLPLYESMAEAMQQDLAAVGIDMNIVPLESNVASENFTVAKTSDAVLLESRGDAEPSVTTGLHFLADSFWNPGGYTTPEITAMHTQALEGATEEERAEKYHQLMSLVVDEAYPNVTLCNYDTLIIHSDDVQGLTAWSDASRDFRGVSVALHD
jgi:peptide/nickel transport system substrate-binding protein